MKETFKLILFVAVISILGSLKNPEIVPCSKKLVTKYYYKGKYIKKQSFRSETYFTYKYGLPLKINRNGDFFTVDSIVIKQY